MTQPVDARACKEHALGLSTELRRAISTFNGKWKLEILWLVSQRPHRFGELRRQLPGVTAHTLTQQLRELGRDGMIRRNPYPGTNPRVEYEITAKALALEPVFQAMFAWASAASAEPSLSRIHSQPDDTAAR